MRFQITIRPKANVQSHDEIAVFIVNAPNWETAQIMCDNRREKMILRPDEVETEIIYASKEANMVRSGMYLRTETVLARKEPAAVDVLSPLDRALNMLLRQDRNTVTDDEHPNHFVNTPLDQDQCKAVKTTAAYLRRINDQAQGVHRPNTREIEVSLFFSAMFAIPLYLFRDGEWICESVDHTKNGGSGPLPSDAINDFIRVNNMHDKKLIALG